MTVSAIGQQAGREGDAYRFEHFTVEDGLSSNTINVIFQDSKGFLWLGTDKGLNRYDGYQFIVYKHDPADEKSLSENFIVRILEDASNNIWIRTTEGIDRIDPTSGQVFRMLEYDQLTERNGLFLDRNGILTIGTPSELIKYDEATRTFDTIPFPGSFSPIPVRNMIQDKKGVLWKSGYDGNLYRFDSISNTFVLHLESGQNRIYNLQEGSNGRLWFTLEQRELVRLDTSRMIVDTVWTSDGPDPLNTFLPEGPDRDLWVGGVGLNRISSREGSVTEFIHDPNNPKSLSSNIIHSLYLDRSGVIWIGTAGGGLNKMIPNGKGFFLFPRIPTGLSSQIVRNIQEDQEGNLLVGFQNEEGAYYKWHFEKSSWSTIPVLSGHEEWEVPWKSVKDSSGHIWIGNSRSGLFQFDPVNNTSKYFPYGNWDWETDYFPLESLYADREGYIWMGFRQGLGVSGSPRVLRLDPKTGRMDDSFFRPGSISPEPRWGPSCIYEDRSGVFWFGSYEGLFRMEEDHANPSSYQFKYFKDTTDQSPASNLICNIHEDQAGRLWIGTYGSGLKRFHRAEERFERIEGLPDPYVYGLLEDRDSNLWISSNKGIYRYNPQAGTSINFTTDDGLQGNEFNLHATHMSEDGRMFFGGMNGLNAFYPEDIQMNTTPPSVFFTDIKVLGKSISPFRPDTTGPLVIEESPGIFSLDLSHSQSAIYIEFASSDLFQPDRNQFEYRFAESGEVWTALGTQNSLLLPYLAPGRYVLEFRGTNRDGVWSTELLSIKIQIKTPWWQTIYFYGALALLIGALVWGFVLWRINFFRRNEKKLQSTVEERTSSLENTLTNLQKTQAQLIQSEKMASLGILSASIAHEINNPLNFSKMSSDALATDIQELKEYIQKYQEGARHASLTKSEQAALREETEAYHKLLQSIDEGVGFLQEGTDRISLIVSGLLTFSRGTPEQFEMADIHQGLDWVVNVLKKRNHSNIRLEKDLDPELGLIECHPGQINQFFLNVLSNAMDAVEEEGGEIQITTKRVGDEIIIWVKDDGIGMPPEVRSKVFDPFFTTKEEGKGTGLGLYICYGIVQAHGGKIEVLSEEGKGTEVIVRLPIHQEG